MPAWELMQIKRGAAAQNRRRALIAFYKGTRTATLMPIKEINVPDQAQVTCGERTSRKAATKSD
jgi:hypothetical protein